MTTVLATSITPFHVVGACLAIWAIVLFALGVSRNNFPVAAASERIVVAISALLVAGAIGTGIGFAHNGPKGGEQGGKKNKTGREGTGAPSKGGTSAPGTGAGAGQQGSGAKPPPASAAAQTLQLSADPNGQLKFDKSTLQAKAGVVRLVLSNPSPLSHNISIQGAGVNKQGPTIGHGGQSQVSAALKPGTYTYYCSVPGHRQAGMQGTLTVK